MRERTYEVTVREEEPRNNPWLMVKFLALGLFFFAVGVYLDYRLAGARGAPSAYLSMGLTALGAGGIAAVWPMVSDARDVRAAGVAWQPPLLRHLGAPALAGAAGAFFAISANASPVMWAWYFSGVVLYVSHSAYLYHRYRAVGLW